ncbi:MAG TPA: hypothetical protein VFE13_07050, partial [Caulobacteraceae bacterium]|nr:hypothetical protein [Caulobacteraceae bacterium]
MGDEIAAGGDAKGGDAHITLQIAPAEKGGDSLDLPKLTGIAAGIGFAIGLLYNLGFFLEIDSQLFALLSYKDHLETLVLFAPFAVVPILLFVNFRARPARRRQLSIGAGGLAALALTAWLERGEIVATPELAAFTVSAVTLAAFVLVTYCAAVILDRGLAVNETPEDGAAREQSFRAMTFG